MIDYVPVIMAGGGGTRFWPHSRRTMPKQFLPITGDEPLLTETAKRLAQSADAKRILVITNAKQLEGSRECLPMVPEENVIGEPVGRDTAPCIGLAAVLSQAQRDDDPVIGIFPADHSIRPAEEFERTVAVAAGQAQEEGVIATVGIRPGFPATGYGYIEQGEAVGGTDVPVYSVTAFKEKPDEETARTFLDVGNYSWNAGMFFCRASTALSELKRQQPEIYRRLEAFRPHASGEGREEALATAYADMPSISFDYAIMEGAARVRVVEASFQWDDVGSWAALARHFPADGEGNVVRGDALAVDAHGNTVVSDRFVGLVGVNDLVVVETQDAILVCSRDRAEEVKKMVQALEDGNREDLL